MAKKIPVLNSNDKHKKSVALLLIRRLLACGIYDEQQRLIAIRYASPTAKAQDVRQFIERRPAYIPAGLPPVEIGGCRFEEPQSFQWREQHRNAVPPSQIGA